MFGLSNPRDRKRTPKTAIACEMLEARNLTTGGLAGSSLSFGLLLPAVKFQSEPVALLLPAVQKVREAAAR